MVLNFIPPSFPSSFLLFISFFLFIYTFSSSFLLSFYCFLFHPLNFLYSLLLLNFHSLNYAQIPSFLLVHISFHLFLHQCHITFFLTFSLSLFFHLSNFPFFHFINPSFLFIFLSISFRLYPFKYFRKFSYIQYSFRAMYKLRRTVPSLSNITFSLLTLTVFHLIKVCFKRHNISKWICKKAIFIVNYFVLAKYKMKTNEEFVK